MKFLEQVGGSHPGFTNVGLLKNNRSGPIISMYNSVAKVHKRVPQGRSLFINSDPNSFFYISE